MTGGGPMVGISKKGMKLSKIVILGGRNDFEKFSFAVSRDFIQEFHVYFVVRYRDLQSQRVIFLTLVITTSPLIIPTSNTQDDGPITMHQGIQP